MSDTLWRTNKPISVIYVYNVNTLCIGYWWHYHIKKFLNWLSHMNCVFVLQTVSYAQFLYPTNALVREKPPEISLQLPYSRNSIPCSSYPPTRLNSTVGFDLGMTCIHTLTHSYISTFSWCWHIFRHPDVRWFTFESASSEFSFATVTSDFLGRASYMNVQFCKATSRQYLLFIVYK